MKKKDLNYYMNLPYEIIVRKLSADEGGGYFASYKDFPCIMGDGESEAEAIADVKKAFKFVIETDLAEGKVIKELKQKTDKTKNLAITLKESLIELVEIIAKNQLKNKLTLLVSNLQISKLDTKKMLSQAPNFFSVNLPLRGAKN